MLCKVLKLTNGDTLIGNIVEESRSYIEVHRPMRVNIVIKNADDDTLSLSMMKWDLLADFNLPSRIFKQSIVSVSEATSEIIRFYGEAYEEFESSEEDEIEIQSDDRMSEIKEEIDRLRAALPSSNNHILH